jgi:hypothetical protein
MGSEVWWKKELHISKKSQLGAIYVEAKTHMQSIDNDIDDAIVIRLMLLKLSAQWAFKAYKILNLLVAAALAIFQFQITRWSSFFTHWAKTLLEEYCKYETRPARSPFIAKTVSGSPSISKDIDGRSSSFLFSLWVRCFVFEKRVVVFLSSHLGPVVLVFFFLVFFCEKRLGVSFSAFENKRKQKGT